MNIKLAKDSSKKRNANNKEKGLNTDPWGMPLVAEERGEQNDLSWTNWIRFER